MKTPASVSWMHFQSVALDTFFTGFTCHVFLILQDVEDASFHFQLQELPVPQSWMWYAQHLSCWVNLWFNTCRLPSWIIVCGMFFCVSYSFTRLLFTFLWGRFFFRLPLLMFWWFTKFSRSYRYCFVIDNPDLSLFIWIPCFHPFGVHKNFL